jgi:hypothetical protein
MRYMCYSTHFPIKNNFHELVLYFIFFILQNAWEGQLCYLLLFFLASFQLEKNILCIGMQVEPLKLKLSSWLFLIFLKLVFWSFFQLGQNLFVFKTNSDQVHIWMSFSTHKTHPSDPSSTIISLTKKRALIPRGPILLFISFSITKLLNFRYH